MISLGNNNQLGTSLILSHPPSFKSETKPSNVSMIVFLKLLFFFFKLKHCPEIFVVDERSYRFWYTAQVMLVSPQRKWLERL